MPTDHGAIFTALTSISLLSAVGSGLATDAGGGAAGGTSGVALGMGAAILVALTVGAVAPSAAVAIGGGSGAF